MREANDAVVPFAWNRARQVKADLCHIEQGGEGLIAAALIDFVRPVEEDRLHLQSALAAIIRMRRGSVNSDPKTVVEALEKLALDALGIHGPWGSRGLAGINGRGAKASGPATTE